MTATRKDRGRGSPACRRWWLAFAAGLVLTAVPNSVASADPASVARRGLEAASMTGGKAVADPSAPDGEALILRAGTAATTSLNAVAARGLVVTVSAACRHAVIGLWVDHAPPSMIRVRPSAWRALAVSMPIASGLHHISVRLIRRRGGCGLVRLDRIDAIPSNDRVLLGAPLRLRPTPSTGRRSWITSTR